MGNGKLAQGCQSGVVGGGVLDVPWGTADLHRLSLKWETAPTGPVAALRERLAGWQ